MQSLSRLHPRVRCVFAAVLSLLVLAACGGDSADDPFAGPPGGGCAAGELTSPDGSCQPACAAGEHRGAGGRCEPAGLPADMACPPGEHALADGRCEPAGLPADMACPPGEHAMADGRCEPAGVPEEACAAGRFVPTGRGGCAPILPDTACPPGQMAVPGETACREVAPCGEGPWNAALPDEETTEYVDQRYPGSDSDGSRERPWKTVAEGIAAAAPGAIVAVSAGRYTEDVVVQNRAVRLWGLCPAQTEVVGVGVSGSALVVRGAEASGSAVRGLGISGPSYGIMVSGAHAVVLEELWVHDARRRGIAAADQASVIVRRTLVEDNHDVGVFIEGSDATVEATVVRATQPVSTGASGWGIDVEDNPATGGRGTLVLTSSLVEDNHELGVFVFGSDATVEATVVRATQPVGTGASGWGIDVEHDPATGERGKLVLTSSLVEDNHDIGVFVFASDATVETTVVRATQPDGTGAFGWGIDVEHDPETGGRGKLVLTSSLVEDNHDIGVFVASSDATVEATVVRATQPDGTGASGWGIDVQADPEAGGRGTLVLTSSLVEDNHDVGVFVFASDATAFATVVRATQPDGTGASGWGIGVQADRATGERGKLVLASSLVEDNHDVGVLVEGSDATVEATVVRATQPDGTGSSGWGIGVQADRATGERGKLVLASSLVEDNHELGVFVFGSDAAVEATVVRAPQPDGTGKPARGIDVEGDPMTGERGKLVLTSSLVEDNHDVGVFVEGSDATVEATVVRATQPDGTGSSGWGIGVQADRATGERGKLVLTSSLVEGNYDVGVFVAGSDVTAFATVVRGTKKAPAGLDFGDGILVLDERGQSSVNLTATVSSDNARAGVLYVGSTGELASVRSSGNRVGLVLQSGTSGAQPTLLEGNMFEGNAEQDRIEDGDLPVPAAAPPLP